MSKKGRETPIAQNIVTHAWNADHSQIAISPNSDEIWIYDTKSCDDPSKWEKIHTLAEHDGFVSGIDWCGETNTIVTCGHDRNAYVWEYADGKWSPGLVILRISRGATSVTWSPDGQKFAVTSGAKCVPVCSFEEKHDFWLSKHIKKGFKSTVVSLAWCVNNKFIVTGSCDFKARIHSAFLPNIDPHEDDGFGELWPEQHTFGACLATFDTARAWINSVAWSPSGFRIAFAGHGGTLHMVQVGEDMTPQDINTKFLPYLDIQFMSDDVLVAGGFDMNPTIYTADGDPTSPEWSYCGQADEAKEKEESKKASKRDAFKKFQGMATRGTSKKSSKGYLTKHQNSISGISLVPGKASKFCTTGMDGRILFWDLKKVADPNLQEVAKSL